MLWSQIKHFSYQTGMPLSEFRDGEVNTSEGVSEPTLRRAPTASRRPRFTSATWRRLLITLIAVFVALLAVDLAVAWYYSDVLADEGLRIVDDEIDYDLTASLAGDGLVRLQGGLVEDRLDRPGNWGLVWDGGSANVGNVVEVGDGFVTRRMSIAEGRLRRPSAAKLSRHVYPSDPFDAFGIMYREVEYAAPLGPTTAWQFGGRDDTWVIFVHGLGSAPRAGMSALPVIHELNLPALFINYRNDEGQPRDPSGLHQHGLTEWRDLQAAVEYVIARQDVRDVVLIGHSMGGGIIMKFLYESPLANRVAGVVMDAPMLDFNFPVDEGGRDRNLPSFIISSVKWMTTARFGVDWEAMDYLKDAQKLDVPVMLFHGEEDQRIPIGSSVELAQLRPDLVTFSSYPQAAHVESWNVDSRRYEGELREFLERVAK